MKKILLLVLSLTMIFSLAACGGDTPPNQSSTPESSVPESSAPESSESTPGLRPPLTERQLKITINDSEVVYARLADSHANNLFIENLPVTIEMDDYINRNKRGPLPFVIEKEDLQNIIYPFETGDIIYYFPTNLLGIFYDHNGAEISAGYELVGQMDAAGIEAFKQLPTDVNIKVTVELNDDSGDPSPTGTSQSSTPAESTPDLDTSSSTTDEVAVSNASGDTTAGSNILVAYFGVPETDNVDTVARASRVAVNGQVVGNTQFLAQAIQGAVGGDLFEIKTVQEYPGLHDPLLDFAQQEQRNNARPELSTHVENMSGYDVIFLGYPNWWADMPQPLYTFLEEYDLSGKTIIPFCPHGGSGFSNTINTISQLQPNADVMNPGYTVSRENVANSASAVSEWAKGLDLS